MTKAIWDQRLLVVIGKGGVGRTTITAALGIAAAKAGKRVCLIEMSGLCDLSTTFGFAQPSYAPREVRPGLFIRSMSAADCLDDFGQRKLRLGRLTRRFMRSRVLGAFIDAVPGLHDLLQLGKIENAMNEPLPGEPVYDVTILDAPATGHGLSMLSAARTMRQMTKIGPFAELARIIEVWLSNQEETAFVLVTLAEELPINECLHFLDELEADRAHLGAIVFNRLRRSPVPNVPAWPEVAKELTTLERPNLDAIVSLIEAGVNESEIQLVRLKNLQKTLADRFQLSPRVSTAFEETSGLDTIADALVSLGQSQ